MDTKDLKNEEYLMSSESCPMDFNCETWESFCENSNMVFSDTDCLDVLREIVIEKAFALLVNNDCMLSETYVNKLFYMIRSNGIEYIERSKYRKGESIWYRWSVKMRFSDKIVIGDNNEPLGNLIERINSDSTI